MILNRLVVPEGNRIMFTLNHKEGDVDYELEPGENYYIAFATYDEPGKELERTMTNMKHFNCVNEFAEGRYVFEIGLMGGSRGTRIILPAVDERCQPLNELIILKKMRYY